MSEHPIVACYRGLDSADAVALGAQMARALDEPLVLASAYRYEPAGLSALPLPAPDNARRAAAAQTALRRARAFAGEDVVVHEHVVVAAGVPDALVALACDVDASVLVVGRDVEGRVTRSLIPRAPCPVAVAPLSAPLSAIGWFERIGVAYDGSDSARSALVVAAQSGPRYRRAARAGRGGRHDGACCGLAAPRAAVACTGCRVRRARADR